MITSRRNSTVQQYRLALKGRVPDRWVVEGPKLLDEALRSRLELDSVLIEDGCHAWTPERERAVRERGVPVHAVTRNVLEAACEAFTPQGIAALARTPGHELHALFETPAPTLLVVACGVQNPGNLGNLVRNAEAFGASGLIAMEGCAGLFRPGTIRGAMGSLFRLPVIEGWSTHRVLEMLRVHSVSLVALERKATQRLDQAELASPLALAVGSEAHGVPAEVREACRTTVAIPQRDSVESLSVSTAAAIALYELYRRPGGTS